jgi:protein-tyrosine phosphatase
MDQPAPALLAVRVMDGLFVGNAIAAQDDEFLFSNKVTHIVNCAGLEAANIFEENGIEYLTFPFRDVPTTVILDNQDRHIAKVTQFIDKTFEKGECVLVHSLHGISRSCTIIGAYLIYKYGWSLEHSLAFLNVAHGEMQIQVYFIRQLKALAKRKFKEKDIFTLDLNTQVPLREQQELLKNTYINSLPYDERNYPANQSRKRHNKRVIFSEDLILKQRTNNLIDPTTNQRRLLQGILKRVDGVKPQPNALQIQNNIDMNVQKQVVIPSVPVQPTLQQQPVIANAAMKQTLPPPIQEKVPVKRIVQSVPEEDSPQLNILTGPEANQQIITVEQLFQQNAVNNRVTSPTADVPVHTNQFVEDKKPKINPSQTSYTVGAPQTSYTVGAPQTSFAVGGGITSPTMMGNSLTSPFNGGLSTNTLSLSTDLGVRKRPTAFSTNTMRPVSAPTAVRVHNPPQKYRKPTPPKRTPPQNAPPPSNGSKQGDPSFIIYSRKSIQGTNGTPQQSPLPSPQQQQPLFYRVNRPPSPNILEGDDGRVLRSSSSVGLSSSMKGMKTTTMNTSLNSSLGGEKRRPASAPKNRTNSSSMFMSGPQSFNNPSDLGIRKSGSSTAISSLKSIYGDDFVQTNGSDIDDDSSSSEMYDDDNRRRKKKKTQKGRASPSESRLMRPTLSFLRKTVKKTGPQ